jgi:sterol desaturase/sphingolipid hydroxylase (fatty acid hydroxylase superfamily)
MDSTIEIVVRLAAFAAVFAVMAAWEVLAPRRELSVGRKPRWPGNLGIVVIDILAIRLIIPTAVAGTALIAAERGWGLFNVLALPGWLAGILGFLLLDLIIYAQHVMFHHVLKQ